MSFRARTLIQRGSKLRPATSPVALRRWLHQPLPSHLDVSKGLGDFLTPEGLRMIAVDWQHGMMERLNDLVRGTKADLRTVPN